MLAEIQHNRIRLNIKFSIGEFMQTRSLRTLLRVAQVGSFAKAAEQLNMTLSAVSMQMKALEVELGVELFDRSVRPPRLTPLGRSIVTQAIPMLECEQDLMELCRPAKVLVGSFRIGFVTSAAVRLLPGFLERAKQDAPNAKFEFETGLSRALQARVRNGSLDAAVVTDTDGMAGGFAAAILRKEPLAFAAHRTLLNDGFEGLMTHHAFFHFMPDTGIGKIIAAELARHQRPKQAETIVLDSLETIMECVSSGLGFTLLPEADIDRYQRSGVEKVQIAALPNRSLVLVCAPNSAVAKRLGVLQDLIAGTQNTA